MAFHVNWKQLARDQITEIWIEAADRRQVSRAGDLIDETLRSDPESFGESRAANVRLAFVEPLAVLFEVFPEDLRVDVLGFQRMDRYAR